MTTPRVVTVAAVVIVGNANRRMRLARVLLGMGGGRGKLETVFGYVNEQGRGRRAACVNERERSRHNIKAKHGSLGITLLRACYGLNVLRGCRRIMRNERERESLGKRAREVFAHCPRYAARRRIVRISERVLLLHDRFVTLVPPMRCKYSEGGKIGRVTTVPNRLRMTGGEGFGQGEID